MAFVDDSKTFPIRVWAFHEAPTALQALSDNGGDEDWLALIPQGTEVPYWIDSVSFGSDVQQITLDDGRIVCIGSHA